MAQKNGYTAEQIIEAIKGSRGFVTAVAKKLGCTRPYVYQLIKKFPTAQAALDDEREGIKSRRVNFSVSLNCDSLILASSSAGRLIAILSKKGFYFFISASLFCH